MKNPRGRLRIHTASSGISTVKIGYQATYELAVGVGRLEMVMESLLAYGGGLVALAGLVVGLVWGLASRRSGD
jgi:hypothetical protein